MSNRLFQSIIFQMKDAVNRILGVIDENGVVVACSELVKIGEVRPGTREEFAFTTDTVVSGGYTYRPIGSGARIEYAVFVEGEVGGIAECIGEGCEGSVIAALFIEIRVKE